MLTTSLGAGKAQQLLNRRGLKNLIAVSLIAADGRGETDPRALQKCVERGPIALALGSEADGLSPEIIQASVLVYRVAHQQIVESLNVAVAGSILMKQVYDCV